MTSGRRTVSMVVDERTVSQTDSSKIYSFSNYNLPIVDEALTFYQ